MMANTEIAEVIVDPVEGGIGGNSICLKTILELTDLELTGLELTGASFKIPAYQRGYKWTDLEVEALLEDINNFKQEEGRGFYCLQPLVVKRQKGNTHNDTYNVVDGQQRLTTILIIWNCLDKDAIKFTIEYETRQGSADFLKEPNEGESDKNIDFYHIYNAHKTVKNWLEGDVKIEEFRKKLLEHTKVIWYELGNEDNEYEAFRRLNSGKIPLTNAELIKALFLMNAGAEMNISISKVQLAMEWDQIEYFLQKDEVWYFLTGGLKGYSSRIELIMELNENRDEIKKGDYWIFNEYLNYKNKLNEKWERIKTIFNKLQNWYANHETYHLVGYLASTDTNNLKELIKYSSTTKKDFTELLKNRIKEQFTDINLHNLSYDKEKPKIKKTLLLFNIITIINQKEKQTRFPFDRYKKEKWDIEHISSQAGDDIKTKDVKEVLDWIKDHPVMENEYMKFLEEEVDSNSQWFIVETLLKDKWPILIRYLNPSIDDMSKVSNTPEESDFELNYLGNLTLLNSSINRSYKNLPFFLKRQWIIDEESKGVFIPLCTRNVFLKYYSDGYSDLLKWNQSDADSYLEKIKKTLRYYLNQEKPKELKPNQK